MSWGEGAMKVAGGATQWYAMHAQERVDARNYEISALTDERSAKQVKASAQRRAEDIRHHEKLLESRALALAGGSAGDVSVVKALGDIAAEGEYRSLSALYEGDVNSRKLTDRAASTRQEAKDAKKAMKYAYASTIFNQGGSLYSKYGNTGNKETTYSDRSSFRDDDPYRNRNYVGGGEGE